MNTLNIIKTIAIILTVLVFLWFLYYKHSEKLSFISQLKICLIGFIANFLDTIGIGSFAVIVALRNLLGVMSDDVRLIGTMNIQAMVTALVQALIFLHFIPLDIITLLVSIAMIALGGFLSGLAATRINKKLVHQMMLIAFAVTGILLLLSQLNLLEIGGSTTAIRGTKLVLFAIFMLISGTLPAFGVGYYSLIKASIFLFGVNPIVAFPIMASASAFQMPVTSVTFIAKGKFYFKSTILLAIFGTIGVLIAAPIITSVNTYSLKWILLGIVIYNLITLAKTKH